MAAGAGRSQLYILALPAGMTEAEALAKLGIACRSADRVVPVPVLDDKTEPELMYAWPLS